MSIARGVKAMILLYILCLDAGKLGCLWGDLDKTAGDPPFPSVSLCKEAIGGPSQWLKGVQGTMDQSKAYYQQQQEEISPATIQKRHVYKQVLIVGLTLAKWYYPLWIIYLILPFIVFIFFTLKITLKTYNISTKAAYFFPEITWNGIDMIISSWYNLWCC